MQGSDLGKSQDFLTSEETTALVDQVQTWRYSVDARQFGFFLAKKKRPPREMSEGQLGSEMKDSTRDQNEIRPSTPGTPVQDLGFSWVVDSLASFERNFFDDVDNKDRYVCFADPSTYPTYPGWMLRNLLIIIQHRWKLNKVQILCYRDTQARRHEAKSMIMDLQLDQTTQADSRLYEENLDSNGNHAHVPKITGWERNATGKLASKIASLGEYMDPKRYVYYANNSLSIRELIHVQSG